MDEFPTERFDRWRERQRWIPAWLDDKPWKSWFITHTGLTLGVGLVTMIFWWIFVNSVIGLPAGFSKTAFAAGTRAMTAQYFVREMFNLRQKLVVRAVTPAELLDHMMDWIIPMLISETINQNI